MEEDEVMTNTTTSKKTGETTPVTAEKDNKQQKRKYVRSGRYSKSNIRSLELILKNIDSYNRDDLSLLQSWLSRIQDAVQRRRYYNDRQLPVPQSIPPGMPVIQAIAPPATIAAATTSSSVSSVKK